MLLCPILHEQKQIQTEGGPVSLSRKQNVLYGGTYLRPLVERASVAKRIPDRAAKAIRSGAI